MVAKPKQASIPPQSEFIRFELSKFLASGLQLSAKPKIRVKKMNRS